MNGKHGPKGCNRTSGEHVDVCILLRSYSVMLLDDHGEGMERRNDA